VTSPGHPYARFRRALDARNPHWASTAALELQHVELADAGELTLIYLDKEPARYERAALRLHTRMTKDLRLGLEDSLAVLSLLGAPGSKSQGSGPRACLVHAAEPNVHPGVQGPHAVGRAWKRPP
jgi:hypothetical protein